MNIAQMLNEIAQLPQGAQNEIEEYISTISKLGSVRNHKQ